MNAVEFRHAPSGSRATVVPERGGIVTRLLLAGRERLYLDEATLADSTKNVRGGIPLLFPSPGKLEGGRFTRGGKTGAMKQHGFSRDLPWTVTASFDAGLTLSLTSTEATRAVYPWDFALTLDLRLAATSLTMALTVKNTGTETMPFGFGIHPYFLVRDKGRASISTAAKQAFDNVEKKHVPFRGFDLTAHEVDLHLLDHGSAESTLSLPGERITVKTRPQFSRWVVWTLAGKDFVCLEPWTCPGDALNTGESLRELRAGAGEMLEIVVDAV